MARPNPGKPDALPDRTHDTEKSRGATITRTRWRRWSLRLTLVVLAPALFALLTEGTLQLAGFGYPTRFLVPTADGRGFTTHRKFAWQFHPRETAPQPNPILLPAEKPPGTVRIFVLGESAAAGTPDPAFGFARILELMLRRQYPDRRFEVLNAAMRGIDSHILLRIARDCARHQPDVFVVYMGNNDAIGLHAPEPEGLNLTAHLGLLRLGQGLKSTRLAQALESAVRSVTRLPDPAARRQDLEFFRRHRLAADDPRARSITDHFRANLEDIGRIARSAGARCVVSTVAVNLRDFPPLGSLHRRGLAPADLARWEAAHAEAVAAEADGHPDRAILKYRTAQAIDDRHAEQHFRLARCLLATGSTAQARDHFEQARDLDTLPFRATDRLNAVVRDFAGRHANDGVVLVETDRAFADSPLADHGIPGNRLFNDHVHFTFDGDVLLARTMLGGLATALGLGTPAAPAPSRDECAATLGFTVWDEYNIADAMARLTAHPPFTGQLEHAERQRAAERTVAERRAGLRRAELDRALRIGRESIIKNPGDWQLHANLASLLSALKDTPAALAEHGEALRLRPDLLQLRMAHAQALYLAGRTDEAKASLAETLRLEPDFTPAQEALAQISAPPEPPRKP